MPGIPLTLSDVLPPVLVSDYAIPSLGVQPSSIVPLCINSLSDNWSKGNGLTQNGPIQENNQDMALRTKKGKIIISYPPMGNESSISPSYRWNL